MQSSIQTINKPNLLTISSDFSKLDDNVLEDIWLSYTSGTYRLRSQMRNFSCLPSQLKEKTVTFLRQNFKEESQTIKTFKERHQKLLSMGYEVLLPNGLHFLLQALIDEDLRIIDFIKELAKKPENSISSILLNLYLFFPWLRHIFEKSLREAASDNKFTLAVLDYVLLRFDPEDDECLQCSICFDSIIPSSYGALKILSCCKKLFHSDCIKSWRKSKDTCPCCRTSSPTDARY